jgi:hypothetical protein
VLARGHRAERGRRGGVLKLWASDGFRDRLSRHTDAVRALGELTLRACDSQLNLGRQGLEQAQQRALAAAHEPRTLHVEDPHARATVSSSSAWTRAAIAGQAY